MQIHELKRHTKQPKSRQIGRGGKRGTTSGRGTKGQKARAGRKLRPELRDIIKKLPKLRGYKMGTVSPKALPLKLGFLDSHFQTTEEITALTLKEKGLIETRKGRLPIIKVLADGAVTKALTFRGLKLSETAKAKVEKFGGQVL